MTQTINFFKKAGSFVATCLIIITIGYIVVNIYKSVLKNYKINEQITKLQDEISEIKTTNRYFGNLIMYYQTKSFKELELRKKLGFKKPDETMMIVPENTDPTKKSDADNIKFSSPQTETTVLPNYLKWFHCIIGN